MKTTILKEIRENDTTVLRAMQDENGREWIVTIVENKKNKEEMLFQTPFLFVGKAVPALEEIEKQLQSYKKYEKEKNNG